MLWPCSGRMVAIGWGIMPPEENAANATFVRELHRALMHLYDPTELGRARLVDLLRLNRGSDPTSSLQRVLLQAIEALKPSSQVPPQANAWRIYHVLNQRYAGQFTSEDVATNLAISGRQLRRLQVLAVQALGDYLWARYNIEEKLDASGVPPSLDATFGVPTVPGIPTRAQELERLRGFGTDESVGVNEMIDSALIVARPLIDASRVRVESRLTDDLPRWAGNATAVRHALLSIFTAAIHSAERGTIEIHAHSKDDSVFVDVYPVVQVQANSAQLVGHQQENLDMARQLVGLGGGSLDLVPVTSRSDAFIARLTLPAVEHSPVLVIEDNADTLQLFERYLTGSRYRFVGVANPLQAQDVAEEANPEIIILDLMLPGIDGWEVLGRLREHPRTRGTPIIVCSILPHEDLALALGAAELIRKPVTREAFLMALDRQIGRSIQEFR